MNAEEYRRSVGMDMINAGREEEIRHPAKPVQKVEKPADQRKQQDEQCGVNGELLQGIVLGAVNPELLPKNTNVLYFGSFEEFEAWCDSEGGVTD